MKKLLLSTTLILTLTACSNNDALPTECDNLLKTIDELSNLKKEKNIPSDKTDMNLSKAKTDLKESVKKDPQAAAAECKQANEILVPMIEMIKAMPTPTKP